MNQEKICPPLMVFVNRPVTLEGRENIARAVQHFLAGTAPCLVVEPDVRVYQLVGEQWELVDNAKGT